MKIALTTFADGSLREIGELTIANKREYAKRHSYDLIVPDSSMAGDRPSAWTKDASAMAALEKYDAVFWTDADCIITDMDRTVESFIADGTEFVFGAVSNAMNNGGFIMRNTDAVKAFLRDAWELPEKNGNFSQFIAQDATKWSQACMIEVLMRDPTRLRYRNAGDDLCGHYWHSGKRFLFHPYGTRLDRRKAYLEERLSPQSFTSYREDVMVADLFGDQRGRVMEFTGPNCRTGIAHKLIRMGWCSCLNGNYDSIADAFGGFGSCDIVGEVPDLFRFHVVSVQRDGVDLEQIRRAAKTARVVACQESQFQFVRSLGFSPVQSSSNMIILTRE